MSAIRVIGGALALLAVVSVSLVLFIRKNSDVPMPPFQAHVDMKTFMEHVLTPGDLISFLENSALADNIRENDVLFPLIESVHVLAICLVVGSILAVDLRLMGLAYVHRSVGSVTRGILPLTWGAFVVALTSGGLMFISNATKYLGNGFFVAKMLLIGAAGLNMAIFHAVSANDLPRWEHDARLPLSARLAGGL